MDHINKVLAMCSNSPSQFCPPICAAITVGKNAINKYYNKTDHSEVYHITMGKTLFDILIYTNFRAFSVLHPCHKLKYFKKCNWEEAWVDVAHDIVRKKFSWSYAPLEDDSSGNGSPVDSNKAVSQCYLFLFCFFSN